MVHPEQDIVSIFRHAVAAVHPQRLIRDTVQVKDGTLYLNSEAVVLSPGARIVVVGAGKAAAAMAQELERVVSPHFPLSGFVVTKYGHALPLAHIELLEAGHPVPDENSVAATVRLLAQLQHLQAADVVIFLLSGGASALLADVPAGGSLQEVQALFELLLQSGADISEINTVRKHLSHIKGGQLAQQIYPATLYTIILSDVVGDQLNVIGSGPAVPDPGTFADTLHILQKYHLTQKMPQPLLQHIEDGLAGRIPDTPKAGNAPWEHVHNILAGTNRIALKAAASKARSLGYHTRLLQDDLSGEARQVARQLVQTAMDYQGPLPACLLAGGETTVTIRGTGKGGRNQELALAAAIALEGQTNITLLSAGTDGTDGPTDAAGAIVNGYTLKEAKALHLHANDFLDNNDAWHFFHQTGGLLITGPTQTNVMDLMILLITAKA
ncbi:glycerate kinase type-2 family protein [Chitinophaga vietnamensis]|uniref:glycerate kinase type-2 family protein n=1 Tax=Chitinophaga vietnamensis TaxID=2593957 RepID=UPI0011787EC3|nr:glycerate kinase [Chitinophaga vietnamensis]